MGNGAIQDLSLIARGTLSVVRFFRRFGWSRDFEAKLKDVYLSNYSKLLHESGIHKSRDFALALLSSGDAHEEHTFDAAVEMCNACANVVATFLARSPVEINCCLKGFSGKGETVVTWARSDNVAGRPTGSDDVHGVDGNTVWSVLTGGDDGNTRWKKFKAFTCNDLTKYYPEKFKCTRENWHEFYQSAVVLPLQYRERSHGECVIFGFLCFDSEKPNTFVGVPDIFAFDGSRTKYYAALERSTLFHASAILADSLSMFLRPFYEQQQQVPITPNNTNGPEG